LDKKIKKKKKMFNDTSLTSSKWNIFLGS